VEIDGKDDVEAVEPEAEATGVEPEAKHGKKVSVPGILQRPRSQRPTANRTEQMPLLPDSRDTLGDDEEEDEEEHDGEEKKEEEDEQEAAGGAEDAGQHPVKDDEDPGFLSGE
jgi:hypothetical protein